MNQEIKRGCAFLKLLGVLLAMSITPSAGAWGCGHGTIGRCILKKLPPEWQAKFKPEWMDEYIRGTSYPDSVDPKRRSLHDGIPVYGTIEQMAQAIRTGDDRLAFFHLAVISHAIADGAACNHDPIIHQLTYTWVPEGTPEGRGLAVLPKTDRDTPFDFAFTESDADTKAVLARRLDALTVPEPPADITLERVFELVDRWHELSMEVNNANTGRIIDAGMKWLVRGDVTAKQDAADALCNLGLWAVARTLWVFKAATIISARPDCAPVPMEKKRLILASKTTNTVELLNRPMANDSFARPYFAEPGRPSRVRVMYSPIDYGGGSVFTPISRVLGCQIVGSLKTLRPELNASLMDAREFATGKLDPKVTPVIVVFRSVSGFRGFDVKGFGAHLRAYAKAGGKAVWIDGKPPECLIGADILNALRDADRKDSYCDPKFPVSIDELMKSSVAWVGGGESRTWKYVRRPVGSVGWYWMGSPQWFDLAALPKTAVPLTELRTTDKTFLTGVACGSCAYIPGNALFAYCLTDERPQLDPFFLRLDSAGESVMLSALDELLR